MESELQKFRRRKEIEQKKVEFHEKVNGVWESVSNKFVQALLPSPSDPPPPTTTRQERNSNHDDNEGPVEDIPQPPQPMLWYLLRGVVLITWLLFYCAFLKIGFGAVYFTISVLLFVYYNTRTGNRKPGEVSAYSVFNKHCESIDGTLKPEHLEKQLLYRGT